MIFSSRSVPIIVISLIVFCASAAPAFAASSRPTCTLMVSHDGTYTEIKRKGNIYIEPGDSIGIGWSSKNARKGIDTDGDRIELTGTATATPRKTTTYVYQFSSGSKRATCSVTAHVVSVAIEEKSLASSKTKPTLTGTAEGVTRIYLEIYKEKGTRPVYASGAIKVKNEKWKIKVSKKLSEATYHVRVFARKGDTDSLLKEEILIIGDRDAAAEAQSSSILVVEPIPLLLGGSVRGGGTVSVSYLQLINVGKEPIVLQGFSLRQVGTAPSDMIADLIAVDDTGSVRGSTREGGTAFKDGVAFVPAATVLAPGETRLFTIKAQAIPALFQHIGKQFRLEVSGVRANASSRAQYPIRGTTWTLAF